MMGFAFSDHEPWIESFLSVAVGTAVIVGLAAMAARMIRSAAWQRAVWQMATLGLLALVFAESTGTGSALVGLWRAGANDPGASPSEADQSARKASSIEPMELPRADAAPLPAEISPLVAELPEDESTASPIVVSPGPPAPPFAEGGHVGEWPTASRFSDLGAAPSGGQFSVDADQTGMAYLEDFRGAAREVPGIQAEPSAAAPVAREAAASIGIVAHGGATAAAAFPGWWLGALWALGALAVGGRMVFARAMLGVFRLRAHRVGEASLCERTARLGRRLGIRRAVSLMESAGLKTPVAFGTLRPVVVFPPGFSEGLDPRQQDAVLAHELAHLAAGDPAWHLAADAVCALLWWHPLAWWQRRRLRAASEVVADEASLLVPGGPDLLAACLVALGRRLAGRERPGWLSVGGTGFRTGLGRRVERLLNLPAGAWQVPGRGRMLLARTAMPIVLAVVAVSCTAWARPQAAMSEGGETMNVLRASWRNSLAAAVITWAAAGGTNALAGDQPPGERLPDPAIAERAGDDGDVARVAEGARDEERPRSEAADAPRDPVRRPVAMSRRQSADAGEEDPTQGRAQEVNELVNAIGRLEQRVAAAIERLSAATVDGAIDVERLPAAQRLLDFEQQRRELLDRMVDLQAELQGLGYTDKLGQWQARLGEAHMTADRVKDRLDGLARRLAAASGQRPTQFVVPADPQRQRQAKALMDAVARLREAGLQDEARELEMKLPEIVGRPDPQPAMPRAVAFPPELVERLRQLETAIDSLRAAGMPEQAEQLMMQRERLRAEAAAMAEARRMPQAEPEMADRLQQQQATIRRLNAEVTALREEMGQMRAMLQQLLDRDAP